MTVDMKPLTQLTHEALSVLYSRLGLADTLRFLNQFTTGHGKYTEERRASVEQQPFEQALSDVREFQAAMSDND